MALPKFVKGFGRLGGVWPTAISILYDKLKGEIDLGKYVDEYLEGRKAKGAEHLREAESSGLENSLKGYASRIVEETRQKISYLNDRVKYVQDAVENGRASDSSVYHAAATARKLIAELFNYPVKRYSDIEQRILGYAADTTRNPAYIGNPVHKLKDALEWWDNADDWLKRLVYGVAKRVEKRALVGIRQRTGLQVEDRHLDAIVDSTARAMGKLKNLVQSKLADYDEIFKTRNAGYASDFHPDGSRVYGTAAA